MSQYLLLEFDDDEQCAALVQKISTRTTIRVKGIFQKPRTYCKCPIMSDTEQRSQVTRGQKYGWWVHRVCGRAHGYAQSPRNLFGTKTALSLANSEPTANYPISGLGK